MTRASGGDSEVCDDVVVMVVNKFNFLEGEKM